MENSALGRGSTSPVDVPGVPWWAHHYDVDWRYSGMEYPCRAESPGSDWSGSGSFLSPPPPSLLSSSSLVYCGFGSLRSGGYGSESDDLGSVSSDDETPPLPPPLSSSPTGLCSSGDVCEGRVCAPYDDKCWRWGSIAVLLMIIALLILSLAVLLLTLLLSMSIL
ncbi:hypothetical protein [Candidatus Ichthyocystis sparus]|uniref:hypothetical protein n=1 Tax=Candidatus Ichthyocystis sparus TaxID=1561004 RepID=UPI000B85086F|nr:hypothetical protein [Candidatus Ichthyocystis sparus]